MAPSPRSILVTGATGRQGKALIRAVLAGNAELKEQGQAPFHVLALTRNATSAKSKALVRTLGGSEEDVAVVQGNLDEEASIRAVFDNAKEKGGIWGVFCVLAFPGLGANADGEEKQGKVCTKLH